MITLIEALNYRCLRYISRPLKPFHVLVGPNASGKTTFLDVVAFLQDLISDGLEAALDNRTNNPQELLFQRQGDRFELAIEARIPDALRNLTARQEFCTARYEVAFGFDETGRQFAFQDEAFVLKVSRETDKTQHPSFPATRPAPESLLTPKSPRNTKFVVRRVPGGGAHFCSERYAQPDKVGSPTLRIGTQRSALSFILDADMDFPVVKWFREYLSAGVHWLVLNSFQIQRPSPPKGTSVLLPDGSSLPWIVARLREKDPGRYLEWIAHLQTSLPDLEGITTFERPEDRHCYMIYEYAGGLTVPSWLVSDGTLRLTALTLPAYLVDLEGIYLIEEPENGIHPGAVSTAFDSLSSMYEAQVLLATHSTVVLNAAELDDVLCFAKDDTGATDIVLGSEHPMLQNWQGQVDLGTLLASGVLG